MKRKIILGDIHGCFDELMQLLDEVGATDQDTVISVGDLVDRGPDNVKLYDYFRARPGAVVVMGNHERKHVRGVLSYSQEIVKLQFGERYEEFRAWAAGLPYYLDLEDVLVVHGGFEDGVRLKSQREDVLSATTSGTKYLERRYGGRYWPEMYTGHKPIAFGHHIVGEQPRKFGRPRLGSRHGRVPRWLPLRARRAGVHRASRQGQARLLARPTKSVGAPGSAGQAVGRVRLQEAGPRARRSQAPQVQGRAVARPRA